MTDVDQVRANLELLADCLVPPTCWFADTFPDAGPCEGRLVRCHLIKQQVLRREVRAMAGRGPLREWFADDRVLPAVLSDPRCWVYGCGGAMGPGGHHGMYAPDGSRPIPRHSLPDGLEAFAEELGLGWYLDHVYGEREERAA